MVRAFSLSRATVAGSPTQKRYVPIGAPFRKKSRLQRPGFLVIVAVLNHWDADLQSAPGLADSNFRSNVFLTAPSGDLRFPRIVRASGELKTMMNTTLSSFAGSNSV